MNQVIIQNCKRLLENYPDLRELINIRKAIWTYWEVYCGIGDYLPKREFLSSRLPHPETLTTAFRAVKRLHPNLRGSENSKRMSLENQLRTKEQLGYSGATIEHHRNMFDLERDRQRRMGID